MISRFLWITALATTLVACPNEASAQRRNRSRSNGTVAAVPIEAPSQALYSVADLLDVASAANLEVDVVLAPSRRAETVLQDGQKVIVAGDRQHHADAALPSGNRRIGWLSCLEGRRPSECGSDHARAETSA